MHKLRSRIGTPGLRYWISLLPAALILISLACSLPFVGESTPEPTGLAPSPEVPPTPTATPQPLPPDLVESDPPQGVELPLGGPITLFFNQPMDRNSVEASLYSQFEQEITFTWVDDTTVVLYFSEPLPPEMDLTFGVGADARSQQGLSIIQPISLNYRTAGYLELAQSLPEPGSVDVDPSAAIVAAFNRPVVPLGADPASLGAAFSLAPAAQGMGSWLNTSTYVFYPDPALQGGLTYTLNLNGDLKSLDGAPLGQIDTWSFTTAYPQLLSIEPGTETPWPLDAEVVLTFNQPMDPSSVEANFSLVGAGGAPVPGEIGWDEDGTVFTFSPAGLLDRGATYVVNLDAEAQARGGTPLGESLRASVIAMPPLAVARTQPAQGERMDPNMGVALVFSAPIRDEDALEYIDIDPPVPDLNAWWDGELQTLHLNGRFAPNTDYTLTVSSALPDIWDGTLGQEYRLGFGTASLLPEITLAVPSEALFLTPQDSSLVVQAVNIDSLPLSVGSVPLGDFITMMSPNGFDMRQAYRSADQRSWDQPLSLEPDRMQNVEIYLTPDRSPLRPGLYYLRFDLALERSYSGPFLLVVSDVQVTYKVSATDALVWAVDMRGDSPLAGAPVTIYTEDGGTLASGQTDSQGIFKATFAPRQDPYSLTYAVIGGDGQEPFGMALSSWRQGIDLWDFGYTSTSQPPGLYAYFYTDRPIYRPGQTVYFRLVARQAHNGRYTLPDLESFPVTVNGPEGSELASFDLPLSAFGTAHGEYLIPQGAQPGYYGLYSPEVMTSGLNFQVANYRKPEINLTVDFTPDQVQAGERINARVDARYFFDAPAGDLSLHWFLYASDTYFQIPGYQVGPEDTSWLDAFRLPSFDDPLGELISEGEGRTDVNGIFAFEHQTEMDDSRLRYTLEVTIEDESGLPVSARDSVLANPDSFYIGVKPDAWVGRAQEEMGFEILTVDWEGEPAGAEALRAEFKEVVWIREDPPPGDPLQMPKFTPQYTPVGSTDFVTNQQGKARLAFTPPKPGTYQLDIYNLGAPQGQAARTQLYSWVGGTGQAVWPNIPNSRLRITSDKQEYLPGEQARIFIPNPYGRDVTALLTIERGVVMDHRVVTVNSGGYTLDLPLTGEQAPNVYISGTLLGRDAQGQPDFRQGYLNLLVAPVEQTLDVTLVSQPERAGPGDEITLEVQVTDKEGVPVQGEFSLAVVDLAALALADPNSTDIVSAFYSEQPNGVQMGLSLAAYTRRLLNLPLGLGGGGGAEVAPVVRESFPDTAYWDAQIVTGSDGRAQLSFTLPDTLTTWQVDTRGATSDTLVGQAQSRIVTTKPLLIRPVTPRFLVVGDHVQLAAVVQNNTQAELEVEASLQASGLDLDDPASAAQESVLPPGGRARLEWWGTVQDVPSVDLVFSTQGSDGSGGDYQDAARPASGALPVLRFISPLTFRTAGVLSEGGEVTELISLPRSFDPGDGVLDVEMSPSLASAVKRALDSLESRPYESTEGIISRFLPNLESYRTLSQFGIEDAALQASLDRNLNESLQLLKARQGPDGGWGWWQGDQSDPYITTYALFGLSRAMDAGITIDRDLVSRAVEFLKSNRLSQGGATSTLETWGLDRLAFERYVLSLLGQAELTAAQDLYPLRGQLSPWGNALLSLTLENLSPGNDETRTILSDLGSNAIRSEAGAHWEMSQDEAGLLAAQRNMHTTLSNSAVVVYALAQRDPGSPLVADAVRYLMAHRDGDGAWSSTYTSAWVLMALNNVIQGTGELGGDFSFAAKLNNSSIAQGQAAGTEQLTPLTVQTPVGQLYADYPNVLVIDRDPGQGRLYYTAALKIGQPVESLAPLSQGLSIERRYQRSAEACPDGGCEAIKRAGMGEQVEVHLTLTLPQDVYYLAVEDGIPAGGEILDPSLKTSQLGEGGGPESEALYDPRRPYASGWGWWLFNRPQIYDDHIAWTTDFLPAGTYELTYTLTLLQPGEFRALPARAWGLYFPEVQAHSAGEVFEITP